jgi:hypothetical protein
MVSPSTLMIFSGAFLAMLSALILLTIYEPAFQTGTYATLVEVNTVGEFWPEVGMFVAFTILGIITAIAGFALV